VSQAALASPPASGHRITAWFSKPAGGPIRTRVVFVLACVLGLDNADLGSVGAIAGKLEHALSLSNTELGLLAATPSICAALMTVPMGVLADRTSRARLLWMTMLAWSAAEALSGFSGSYVMLLPVRGRVSHAGPNGTHGFGANATAHRLQLAFLTLLITLALGGVLTFLATRTYPRDVATARASETDTASEAHTPRLPQAA
jgi:MFS family permease